MNPDDERDHRRDEGYAQWLLEETPEDLRDADFDYDPLQHPEELR